ncbi:MAG: hypothetical protein O3C21_19310, partial [Verrucomicrobia bacterium]|nr:hypothetical protein [Verrucomicrobiota bacterium]
QTKLISRRDLELLLLSSAYFMGVAVVSLDVRCLRFEAALPREAGLPARLSMRIGVGLAGTRHGDRTRQLSHGPKRPALSRDWSDQRVVGRSAYPKLL